jgi:hypothetical protein
VARRPFDASAAGALIIVAGALRLAAAIIGLAMWWLEHPDPTARGDRAPGAETGGRRAGRRELADGLMITSFTGFSTLQVPGR